MLKSTQFRHFDQIVFTVENRKVCILPLNNVMQIVENNLDDHIKDIPAAVIQPYSYLSEVAILLLQKQELIEDIISSINRQFMPDLLITLILDHKIDKFIADKKRYTFDQFLDSLNGNLNEDDYDELDRNYIFPIQGTHVFVYELD